MIQIWSAEHGIDHPDVALGMNNLGNVERALGNHTDAQTLFLKSLTIREKFLGKEHPDVGTTLKNLAELYREVGRNDEAAQLYHRAVIIVEKSLGPNHPAVSELRAGYAPVWVGK